MWAKLTAWILASIKRWRATEPAVIQAECSLVGAIGDSRQGRPPVLKKGGDMVAAPRELGAATSTNKKSTLLARAR